MNKVRAMCRYSWALGRSSCPRALGSTVRPNELVPEGQSHSLPIDSPSSRRFRSMSVSWVPIGNIMGGPIFILLKGQDLAIQVHIRSPHGKNGSPSGSGQEHRAMEVSAHRQELLGRRPPTGYVQHFHLPSRGNCNSKSGARIRRNRLVNAHGRVYEALNTRIAPPALVLPRLSFNSS
jgi:hypothetical protein